MADATLEIDIIANDRASAVISGLDARTRNLLSGKAGSSIKGFGEALDGATKPLQAASVGIIAAGAASGKLAIDFEKNFAAVKKTVDGTPEQLEAVKKGIIDLTTVGIGGKSALPATTTELTAIAAAAGQLGIETENIVEFTEVMAQMGSATNLYGEAGAATLARFMNVTNTDQGLIRNLGSSIVALGNNFATTEAEIAAMAMRMGATGTIVGMSTQDILAYSTALSSLGIEAEAGGSAFSRILMSISTAVSSGGAELSAFAKTAGMTRKEFADAWKSDATGTFKTFLEGLSKNEDIISKLEELGFANIRDIQGLQNLSGERGIELITKALELSNTAWEENTALQKEADAMSQTLAGQLTITKNNIIETGRSFGEFIMPGVAGASDKIRELARGLSALDDEQKKSVISAAGNIAGLGIAAKGVSAAAKGIGGIASGLSALGPAGAAAVIGVGAVTAAVVAGRNAYEEYQYSQKHWADGAAEAAGAASEAANEVDKLSGLQKEIKDLQLIISSDESTKEEVEAAKNRIDEIVQLLANEYNLTIETNNENLDETIGKLQTAIDKYKETSRSELALEMSKVKSELTKGKSRYDNSGETIAGLKNDYDEAAAAAIRYNDASAKAEKAFIEYQTALKQGDTSGLRDMLDSVNSILTEGGFEDVPLANSAEGAANAIELLNKKYSEYSDVASQAKSDMEAEEEAVKNYESALNSLINGGIALAESGDVGAGVKNMQAAVTEYGAAAEDVALKWSLVKNGFETVDGAKAAGALETVQKQAVDLLTTYFNIPLEIATKVIFEPDTTEVDIYTPENKTATVTYKVAEVNSKTYKAKYDENGRLIGVEQQAKGTQNFRGGLAMVNDETGISDPRELIVDRGRAFIPQGRNVILPLSRGAKVYTAAQTKALMSALGIPRYTGGKDNSDAFINATDALSHKKATTAMTTSDELAEWVKLSGKFKGNLADSEDILENIYSLTRKENEELNEASKKYISERIAMNDWDEYGDDPISAYNRVKERNLAEFRAGRLTWSEYTDIMSDLGEDMYDERVKQSLDWLEHERKYNNMSEEDYIAGLQRIQAWTRTFYENGLIDHQKYREGFTDIDEKYLDSVEENNQQKYSDWQKSMSNWIDIRSTYDDWDEYGDSLSQTYARAITRVDELYKDGVISWQEAEDAKLDYSLKMYDAAADEYDAVLKEQADYISDMRDQFAAEEAALRESWEVADRTEDLKDIEKQLAIYENASTDAGREKYKQLLEQKEQLEREEQLYQMQKENNAIIEALEAEYAVMEEGKKKALAGLKISCGDIEDTGADISATSKETRDIAAAIGVKYVNAAGSTLNSLAGIADILYDIKKVLGSRSTNTYNDSRTVNIAGGVSESYVSRLIDGTIVSGLGSVMFSG